MPKLTPSTFEERRRITRACITANQERYGYTDEQLAKRLCISVQTFRKRMKDPDNFTLCDLQSLSRTLKFTPIQAASIILGRDITAKEVKDFILM